MVGKWLGYGFDMAKPFAICHLPFAISVLKNTRTCAPWDEETCISAAECGHFEVLQWAYFKCPLSKPNKSRCVKAAIRAEHTHIAKWIQQHD
jgi:hypothetical protein